ncbi:Glucosaminyl phosphatidylinositol (GlcN-PI) nositol acylation protein [Lithohypha guttulata]|uniref:Glucosaminyl phosphatidylinositol (GlcN-PI) nositol acylation protein n=1 Tax=Lithohypha guttulata TaxID=1690604 RepID=UPI00315D248D
MIDPAVEMHKDAAAYEAAMRYKLRKEAFVSNLSGSSLVDINLVTLVAASAILLWTALSKRGSFRGSDMPVIYMIDFLLNVSAILFAFTMYSSVPVFLNLALTVPAALLLLPLQQSPNAKVNAQKREQDWTSTKEQEKQLKPGTLIVRPFLTNYRGAMLIATSIAILAVDFHIFPRRFAKVETWGTSLMDLGVGSFVFSAGLVSARTVVRDQQQGSWRRANLVTRMIKALRHSVPLLVLGVVRLISVKNLDYAEHVSEYGVHWNFFFTLALLPPCVETVDNSLALFRSSTTATSNPSRRSVRYDLVALSISLAYEILLNNTRLLSFILIAPRTPDSDLLTKNREGIFSFFGYLAVFLCGRSTGILVCQFRPPPNQIKQAQPSKARKAFSSAEAEASAVLLERNKVILPELVLRSIVFVGLYMLSASVYAVNLTVSRRLANLPYVLWIAAFNNGQLALFAFIEALGPKFVFLNHSTASESGSSSEIVKAEHVASPVMQAYNKNGLAIFLVANLGTGLVNLTVDTLNMSAAGAMGVLLIYAGALTVVAVGLHRSAISIKI